MDLCPLGCFVRTPNTHTQSWLLSLYWTLGFVYLGWTYCEYFLWSSTLLLLLLEENCWAQHFRLPNRRTVRTVGVGVTFSLLFWKFRWTYRFWRPNSKSCWPVEPPFVGPTISSQQHKGFNNLREGTVERHKSTKELNVAPTNKWKVRPTPTVFNCWGSKIVVLQHFSPTKEKNDFSYVVGY